MWHWQHSLGAVLLWLVYLRREILAVHQAAAAAVTVSKLALPIFFSHMHTKWLAFICFPFLFSFTTFVCPNIVGFQWVQLNLFPSQWLTWHKKYLPFAHYSSVWTGSVKNTASWLYQVALLVCCMQTLDTSLRFSNRFVDVLQQSGAAQ
jgi:hypothetical protein